MSFDGFGKYSGPRGTPKPQPTFGYPQRPPSPTPPLSSYPLQRSPRDFDAPERTYSPQLAFHSNHAAMGPSYPSAAVFRSTESPPKSGEGLISFIGSYDAQARQRPSAVNSFHASQNSGAYFHSKISPLHDLKRTKSPQLLSTDEDIARNSRSGGARPSDSLFNDHRNSIPEGTPSPPLFPENHHSVENFGPSIETQRLGVSPPVWGNKTRLPGNFSNSRALQDRSAVFPNDSRNTFATKNRDVQVLKRTRSPPANEVSLENSHFSRNDSKRRSASPPRLGTRSNTLSKALDSEIPRFSLPSSQSIADKAAATKPSNFPVPKRTRSPPLPSTDQVFQGSSSTQDDVERELQAKAKRLARFKVELSQTVQSTSGIGNQKVSVKSNDQSFTERRTSMGERSTDMAADFPNGNVLSDYEGPESSTIITGLCPDMCPESERAERERKGDLDQYERLDGDRNRTSQSLAVKKYNRTAEREADLIRPMPILQKTIDYLLYLLDQPYDDKFLGLYNFLWDRMRAIRMDLRMQHIFNLDAITMLEQMIRLHIIAMHELCEYTKGEGFSEGFDAHLNIEQMNKTSVELFQLYDDHRKKKVQVPTEKEFRGYYALLKLDKHPGYKVEPAELSLDLSKMTPEIRQTPEVLFARDVARACRTGNFIAFFRLARKASYLQACLMHAHFAKLRTQALASLHCGLQNNQGIPIAQIAKWLAMEEEDIEKLLEYHGFSIKEYEEPYMVKEGSFLNSDNDFPVKCSNLVHTKKSPRIVENVSSPHPTMSQPAEEVKEGPLVPVYVQEQKPVLFVNTVSLVPAVDEEMDDYEVVPSPKDTPVKPVVKALGIGQQFGDGTQMAAASPLSWDFTVAHNSPKSPQAMVRSSGKPNYDIIFRNSLEKNTHSDAKAIPSQIMIERVDQEKFARAELDSTMENSVPHEVFIEDLEHEEHTDSHQAVETEEAEPSYHDEEVAVAKLKLIIRIWKRRSVKKRELREQRQLAAMAALNSLSLGPQIRQDIDQPSTSSKFNIDRVVYERSERHERSWSKLNVSDVIAGTLSGRNQAAKCLCWKIILFSQMDNSGGDKLRQLNQVTHFTAGPWLLSKLMPTRKDDDDDLILSSPGLSIWRKWVRSPSGGDLSCCLSIIRDAKLDNMNETVLGASAVLFLVSESISLEIQKSRLHNLVMSLPSGSCLPLLIIIDSHEESSDSSSIMAEKLGLHDIDKSRVIDFTVVSLAENRQLEECDGFFSDEQLRGGLQWLASESPLQPVVSCVKTRELVLAHLSSSLAVLDEMGVYEVGPEQCISAFNKALHQAVRKIATAADANPISWPCPEIALLEKTSNEYEVAKLYLPDIGWSSLEKIELLISALRGSELPRFQEDISWLYRGSKLGREIENQRLQLENCLIRYLTESSKMMGPSLATNEARVMLQKGARLELHNSTYYIVPNWAMLFQRVFNWRLMSLSNGAVSTAYVLEQHDTNVSTSPSRVDKQGLDGSVSSHYYLIHPSLDEMVQVGCGSIASCKDHSEYEAFQPPQGMLPTGSTVQTTNASNTMQGEMRFSHDDNLSEANNNNYIVHRSIDTSSGLVVATKAAKEADNLSKLLKQCNILQDTIDKQLSVYF
ncbi:SAC3 family protein B-like isoform X1 [Actinidia eriantha]|uniref:SAC3 family protein B-like isoform X1 n=1 Tax=Actinidia eriantha TaxID=165200 RepID=UPI00259123E0|nr:SAC3 family protein B-like isoform X1 [Actinidia eriantha]